MCTAATYQTKDFYMGRTLDYEFSYGEKIAIFLKRILTKSMAMPFLPSWATQAPLSPHSLLLLAAASSGIT